jgi:hypothetical protein
LANGVIVGCDWAADRARDAIRGDDGIDESAPL